MFFPCYANNRQLVPIGTAYACIPLAIIINIATNKEEKNA
jgi:hypothetical protein